ncbi:MAG TPA: chorismate synthase [Chitinophagaceae bacterium]|nr:chorismate synthase [Chitinophagaceae bacterium]
MNSFGRIFRISIFGESHGESVGIVVDGCPAGMPLTVDDFLPDLERRKGGTQKGTTPRQEEDLPIFKSGLFNNKTTGAPITILFENKNIRSGDYEKQRDVPRPGHADFVAHKKFAGFEDYRGSGHFSGRLTVALVAAGVIAKKSLSQTLSEGEGFNSTPIKITSSILEIGGEKDLDKGLQKAIDAKDSIGGIIECRAAGLPVGLGEPFFDSAESLLSHIVFAIPAVRGIEFGTGFAAAKMFGSEHNDPIENMEGKTRTNHAGGIVGGLTNGNELVFRIAIKPTSSTPKEQNTLNWETGKVETASVKGRHDLCIALRVPVILEAVTAIVLADLMMLEQRIPRVNKWDYAACSFRFFLIISCITSTCFLRLRTVTPSAFFSIESNKRMVLSTRRSQSSDSVSPSRVSIFIIRVVFLQKEKFAEKRFINPVPMGS